ncbi:hypothetical protein [Dyadobacter sp. CY356]|uniref:hypothetical protein n=1 Tax=Dyadobacter sp. CY356 TaxID=2906442 RepID=UPI001F34E1AB|nr:hypothetical protein [Dyadobacter sp. CY356]MCF0055505.1 hypothetical protein [Dyadobacter sp. CY356]
MYPILNYAAPVIVGLSIGYAAGHWIGANDGEKIAIAEQSIVATKEAVKATSQREKIDHEISKLTDPAIDAELSANGWMRK